MYAFAIIEFLSPFSSYSPTLPEGYLDSTTLHAAFIAVESELLGDTNPSLARDDVFFSSLLPTGFSKQSPLPLLPPLKLPVLGGRVWGFWTPRAARRILELIERCKGDNSFLAYDADKSVYNFVCQGKWIDKGILYDIEKRLFYVDNDDAYFEPPQYGDEKTRIVLDRVTQAATPYLVPSVIARSPYWFLAKLPSDDLCNIIVEALKIMRHVGLGAYRSSGFGKIVVKRINCLRARDLSIILPPEFTEGSDSQRSKITLGLLLPNKPSCQPIYGKTVKFGRWRGFAGRILNFKRPLVTTLAPGSIIESEGDSCGEAVSSKGFPLFYYSFNPLLFPV